ncbi:hypothetical protein [Marinobacter sp. HN1S83]|uniref:tetratricopeptide repeat protein n=1 Tax=Marinobacter sp. HN1S83 TaxID=3382301 RepID=UPI00387ABF21
MVVSLVYRRWRGCVRWFGFTVLLAAMLLSSVAASEREQQSLAAGLARFALASGQPERAQFYASNLSEDPESWLKAQMASGRSDEVRQQAIYEQAELERRAGHRDRAGQLLSGMEAGYWAALGYMNLAADYSKRDLNPTRALVALRVALAMSEQDTVSERSTNLRSQLLVRAGYLSYLEEEYQKAIGFLEQVPLNSYYTPRALYFHGLALAARNNHRAAMQSWHRAKKYPLAYPGVEDAWLGIGQGYDLSGYLGQAGEAYLAANASFESERVTLRKLASRIRQDGAWKALVQDARDSDAQWFLADNRTLTQPRMAYLLRFMESPAAQDAVARVSELTGLAASLEAKVSHLRVFRDSLTTRLATSPAAASDRKAMLMDRVGQLRARVQKLEARISDPQQLKSLTTTGHVLGGSESSLVALDERLAQRNTVLERLLTRTEAAISRLGALQSRASGLRVRAETVLDEKALAFVARQDERMGYGLDKTEQQIAHLYEYLALESLEKGGQ